MQVTLVNPRLRTWSPNVYPPLGLCYIAASLENIGHDVYILDMNSSRVSDRRMLRETEDSDVVGITGMVTEFGEVARLGRVLKARDSRTVILGGPLATTHPTEILEASGADFAVIGEGEQTIVELIGDICDRTSGDRLTEGLAFRDNKGVAFTPPRELVTDLDSLPMPARYLLDMGKYTTHHFKTFGIKIPRMKSTTMISSRGCPYSCTFCFKQVGGRKWQARSPENMLAEMEQLEYDYDITGFVFNDDTFVLDRERVIDFCGLLGERIPEASWYCNGRVDLMDEEMLEAMACSGCKGVAYGIESGNQGMLDRIKKGIKVEQIERVTELTKQAGIHVTGYFMLGMLGDSKRTIEETLAFAEKLDLNFYGFGITSPIPGTEMHREAKEKGIVEEGRLEDWSFHAWVNMTEDCTKEELEGYNEYAFRKFTMEKRWGKRYLLNWRLWAEGIRTVVFLIRKRNVGELVKKVTSLIRPLSRDVGQGRAYKPMR